MGSSKPPGITAHALELNKQMSISQLVYVISWSVVAGKPHKDLRFHVRTLTGAEALSGTI